jgi:hypothetical protein
MRPTEAEIRANVEDRIRNGDRDGDPTDWAIAAGDGVYFLWPRRDEEGDLTEGHPRLVELVGTAQERIVERVIAIAIDEYTAAGEQFASEHPGEPWELRGHAI